MRVLYDDDALYVGARLYDSRPDSIRAQLARRDRITSSDRFLVFLDSYHDRRTGFYFGINAAGTLYDGTLFNDDWDSDTWDGVWEGKVRPRLIGMDRRAAHSLFPASVQAAEDARWGINFKREIARRNERDYLVPHPEQWQWLRLPFRGAGRASSRFTPPRRMEVLPYVTTRAEYLSHEARTPSMTAPYLGAGMGGDLKLGIGSNLTLDATVNPDFGQVEVDPAVVNLSDVETFFDERRPFFVEGASIFNFGVRRSQRLLGLQLGQPELSSTPGGSAEHPRRSFPTITTIPDVPSAAATSWGRQAVGKGGHWSLGALSAFTSREHAQFALGQQRWQQEVEPLTYYGVYRAQKEMQGGRHGLGFIGTLTARSFDEAHLPAELSSTATGLGMDGWTTLDRSGMWVISGWAGLSRVRMARRSACRASRKARYTTSSAPMRHISAWIPVPRL